MKSNKVLSITVSIVVLSAWSIKLNQPSNFRGGNATNMSEEFANYGLDESTMIIVGVCKVLLSILLLLGALKYSRFIQPAAAILGLFMMGAVYFHISIGDGVVPTLAAASMLLICLVLTFYPDISLSSSQKT